MVSPEAVRGVMETWKFGANQRYESGLVDARIEVSKEPVPEYEDE